MHIANYIYSYLSVVTCFLYSADITTWSKEKVAKWIRSILKEVALYRYPSQQTLDLFIMDGKSLLYLSAEDLYQRDPDLGHLISEKLMDLQKSKDVVYTHAHMCGWVL